MLAYQAFESRVRVPIRDCEESHPRAAPGSNPTPLAPAPRPTADALRVCALHLAGPQHARDLRADGPRSSALGSSLHHNHRARPGRRPVQRRSRSRPAQPRGWISSRPISTQRCRRSLKPRHAVSRVLYGSSGGVLSGPGQHSNCTLITATRSFCSVAAAIERTSRKAARSSSRMRARSGAETENTL